MGVEPVGVGRQLQARLVNAPDLLMKRGATYSDCRTLRWTLTREWAAGPSVCYIGHNPSTAGDELEDPTSRAWVHHASFNGFGRYTSVNLYPYRTPDVKECYRWAQYEKNGPDWSARDALMENESLVAAEAKKADIVVACWGALAVDENWVEQIIQAVQADKAPHPDIYCLGRTLAGDPKHPMARGKHRIARDQQFMLWRKAAA